MRCALSTWPSIFHAFTVHPSMQQKAPSVFCWSDDVIRNEQIPLERNIACNLWAESPTPSLNGGRSGVIWQIRRSFIGRKNNGYSNKTKLYTLPVKGTLTNTSSLALRFLFSSNKRLSGVAKKID